jgi:hypothetical protein
MTYPVRYDPDTGVLFWLPRTDVPAWWNTRYAGKPCAAPHNGYLRFHYKGEFFLVHRMVWFLHHGYWPDLIDHINGDKSDNRMSNLREASRADNSRNMRFARDAPVGVRQMPGGKFQARIGLNGAIHVGTFASMDEAVAARREALIENGYHQNHGG